MIGQTISHYKILEKLGGGGMGVVYKAEDTKLKRLVALKFLPPDLTRDEEAKERFVHEARAASALDHPNICVIHEIDETEDGRIFICMAYYEGETLKKKVASGTLPVAEAIDIAIQIAQGLAKAHEYGITHRDIKPANVMITKDGIVKILDFGLAKLAGASKLTKTGATVGTVAYMSPEQTRGAEVDHRTDIWSLGVVLYEMITGQLPFKGEYEQAVMYSIVNEEPKSILTASGRTDVPLALEQMVNKALAKCADERYQQLSDLLVDLKSLSKELETAGKLQSRRVGIAARVLRKKWLKKAIIPAGVVLVAALGFLLFRPLLFEEALISEPKPIAVISFENHTGDEQYDYLQKAIPNLLITSLEQSKYLRVATWERMHDLLKQIGKENVERIDKELGFELCRLDGINTVVIGSYTRAGEVFVTDVKVLEVTTKALMKSAKSQGKGVASILDRQIDELSREIARGVGLSKRQIEAAQIPIAEVTTTSMEAYNYFMRGREEWEKLYFDDAKKFLKKAVEIDSTFAMAYLYLTLAYVGLDRTKVKETLEKAKAFAEHATDKEKLYINYFYEKAIEYFKRYAAVSPGDANPFDSMADIYLVMGKLDEALAKYKEAVEVKPEFIHSYMKIAYIHALRENYAEVMKPLDQFIAMAPSPLLEGQGHVQKAFFHHYWLGQLEPCLQEIHTAKNLFDRVGAAADKALLNWVSAWIYYDRGEFEVSRRHFENGFKISMEHPSHTEYGSSYDRAAYSFGLGFVDLQQGKIDSARSRLADMKALLPEIDAAVRQHITCIIHKLHHKGTKSTKNIEFKAFSQTKLSFRIRLIEAQLN